MLVGLAVTLAGTAAGWAADNNTTLPHELITSGTVTQHEPPPASDDWTAERMRNAKPFPMPARKGPPVPPQVTPSPYQQPPGSSPSGFGGSAPR